MKGKLISEDAQCTFAVILNTDDEARPASSRGSAHSAIACSATSSRNLRRTRARPIGGSGSTLIACEETGRLARLVELDPRYCDVIARGCQNWAGARAVLDGDGWSYEEIAPACEAAAA
jgi:hypothetical protein